MANYCINCKNLLINRDKKGVSYDCTAEKASSIVPGDAIFPPVETKSYADPYQKNANNDCPDYSKKKQVAVVDNKDKKDKT